MRRPWAVAAALVVLAACGELPQPFRPETVPELARPRLVRAVAVRPVDGLPSGPAMAEALVKAFGDLDVPALVAEDLSGSLVLAGNFDPAAGAVDWTLLGTDRQPQAEFRQSLPPSALRPGAADLAGPAQRVVAALTAAAPPPTEQGSAPPSAASARPNVRIVALPPLPGDGASALDRHLRQALERSGIVIVAVGGQYLIEGRVEISPAGPGQQSLKVAWVVERPDGTPLGTVDQRGLVASGALDGAWGGLARDIAEGGTTGIVQVIDAAYRAALKAPPGGASSLQN